MQPLTGEISGGGGPLASFELESRSDRRSGCLNHQEAALALDIPLATLITRLTKARERVVALTRELLSAAGRSLRVVKARRRAANLHAYVDDCLEPDECLAFETQIAQNPLARRAAQWRAQNAIRAASTARARDLSISVVRHQNDVRQQTLAAAGGKPPRTADATAVAHDRPRRTPKKVAAPYALQRSFLRRLGFAALPRPLLLVAGRDRRPGVDLRGRRRGFFGLARPGVEPVEFATSDGTAAQSWLTTRLNHPVDIPRPAIQSSERGSRSPWRPGVLLIYKSQKARRIADPVA